MSKGDDVILTENQYQFYKEHHKDSKVAFSEVEISPSFVVQAWKRPAQYIRNKYPCPVCHMGGRNADNSGWCPSCKGSGVQLPKTS